MAYFIDAARLKGNIPLQKAHEEITGLRGLAAIQANHAAKMAAAAGYKQGEIVANATVLPRDAYLSIDTVTKEMMLSEDGFTLLNDLEGISKNVSVGKIVDMYRRYDAGDFEVRTSIDGQHAKPVDRGSYDYDGTLITVHTTGVGAAWRDMIGMREEGFDQLLDDQRIAVRFIRERMAKQQLDGAPDLQFKGYKAFGIRNSPNVMAFDIAALAGGTLLTGPNGRLRDAFRKMVNQLHGAGNNANGLVTFYVSPEIWERMSEIYVPVDATGTAVVVTTQEIVLDILKRLPGVDDIKVDSNFTGDELTGVIRRAEYIQPIIGMPVTSVPIERRHPMDEYQHLVWSATGLQIKADAKGRTGVIYASKA